MRIVVGVVVHAENVLFGSDTGLGPSCLLNLFTLSLAVMLFYDFLIIYFPPDVRLEDL